MPNRRRQDPKLEALRERGTLNPKPEGVLDQLFRESEFFDARDLVQVKYEMIRRVDVEGAPVAQAAHAFGFSRPSFYEAQAAFSGGGLPALLPKKRGPRGAHKLGQEVLAFIEELRAGDSTVAAPNIVQLLKERFGLTVHRRSVERALVRGQRTDKRAKAKGRISAVPSPPFSSLIPSSATRTRRGAATPPPRREKSRHRRRAVRPRSAQRLLQLR